MTETKRALVTGAAGQDGSYLTELLLSKGYEVHALVRSHTGGLGSISHIFHPDLHVHHGDVTDGDFIHRLLYTTTPHEIYNLAAQSHVGQSFKSPVATTHVNGVGAVQLFSTARHVVPDARVYQASTSELFGSTPPPQHETTPMRVRSPYAAAKLMAHEYARVSREAYDQHISCGILFNHESPRRPHSFVTRKITRAVARIKLGRQHELVLGNTAAERDWGHARDYVEAMWRMLQQDVPDDYVIATGQTRSVGELVTAACRAASLDERNLVMVTDPALYRPADVHALCGDPSKAADVLDWKATTTFEDMIAEMVAEDLKMEG